MWARLLILALAVFAAPANTGVNLFTDDFEHGLDRWRIVGENGVMIKASGDPSHGSVMELVPNGDVSAIIKDSSKWGRVRLEGEMLFPTNVDNYLGFIYNLTERNRRQDFGLIYVKGNQSYLQANPQHDFNVTRLVYPELRTNLTGSAAVKVNAWQRFAIEIDGVRAHVYVGSSDVPQMTFDGFEYDRGPIGLQPRSVGGPVWVDNVRVRSIGGLSYSGPSIPSIAYDPTKLLTNWQVAGPFDRTDDDLGRHPDRGRWAKFETDARGAIITGRVVDYHGPNTVAYFRSTIASEAGGESELEFSTSSDLSVWLNGRFMSGASRQEFAWFDFATNKEHQPRRLTVTLKAGRNDLVVRVRGGAYAEAGFFSRVATVQREP
jgi:hypothetical protein